MKNELFRHFLITRFNIVFNTRGGEKKRLNEKWLENRFELFEKYCLPSVISQKNTSFKWFVFFHKDTPEIFKKRIEGYKQLCPVFSPVYISSEETISSHLSCITKDLIGDAQWIITSRVDNDDIIKPDYIDIIQKNFEPKHNFFIDFPFGRQLDANSGKLYFYYQSRNPFISRIEKIENYHYNTIYEFMHHDTYMYGEVKSIKEPIWVQVVHGGNCRNAINSNRSIPKAIRILSFLKHHPVFFLNKKKSYLFLQLWQRP